ncbi:MAG: type II toxin-antitoxin system HicB family antitoxin [Verrucomicrobiota bacterium]
MIREYIRAAMGEARFEILKDDNSFYGEIPLCPGVMANCETLEGCREKLEEVLEEWLLLRIHRHLDIPPISGTKLEVLTAS